MKVLIIFESIEGQTRKIAEFVAQLMRSAEHEVLFFNTAEKLKSLSFEDIDKVVLMAPVHERCHPQGFEVLLSANLDELRKRQTLLLSISLKAAFAECKEEAQEYLTEMKMRTRFEPDKEMLVAGAVRTGSYGYFESQVVQYVVLDGRRVDLVNGEREFTDWDAINAEVAAFLRPAPEHIG